MKIRGYIRGVSIHLLNLIDLSFAFLLLARGLVHFSSDWFGLVWFASVQRCHFIQMPWSRLQLMTNVRAHHFMRRSSSFCSTIARFQMLVFLHFRSVFLWLFIGVTIVLSFCSPLSLRASIREQQEVDDGQTHRVMNYMNIRLFIFLCVFCFSILGLVFFRWFWPSDHYLCESNHNAHNELNCQFSFFQTRKRK